MTGEQAKGGGSDAPTLVGGTPRTDAPVAVVVPVYQGGAHLAATLDSVLAQTLRDIEIVVVDNASTDTTPDVLAGYRDARMAIWRSPRTVPMIENFNRAVGLSRAPLVKVVAADDLLEPDCLARQVADLDADPTLAMVVGRKHLVDPAGRVLARARFLRRLVGTFDRHQVVREVVRTGANPIGADVAVTFRRTAFEAAGGYRDTPMFADLDLWVRLLAHGRLHGEEAVVARFRIAPGTRSAAADDADWAAQKRFLDDLVAAEPTLLGRRDLAWARLRAPLARWRREALFALVRSRHSAPVTLVPSSALAAPVDAEVASTP